MKKRRVLKTVDMSDKLFNIIVEGRFKLMPI